MNRLLLPLCRSANCSRSSAAAKSAFLVTLRYGARPQQTAYHEGSSLGAAPATFFSYSTLIAKRKLASTSDMGAGGSKRGKEGQKSEKKRSPETQKTEGEQTSAEAQALGTGDEPHEGYVQATVAQVSEFGDNE